MHPLRTRLVRAALPVVVGSLAVVGSLSLGLTAVGAWFAGERWMESSAESMPELVESLDQRELLEAYELAAGWPALSELRPDQGVIVWTAAGRETRGVARDVVDLVGEPEIGVHLVTRGGRAWLVSVAPLRDPGERLALVCPVGDDLAADLAEARQVEVLLAVDGRAIGTSLVDTRGTPVPAVLPPEVSAERVGAATFPAPDYGGYDGQFLVGADTVPAFFARQEVPAERGSPIVAVALVPREVLLGGPIRGGVLFAALSVAVTALAGWLLISIVNRHVEPVFRAVAHVRVLIDQLGRHLGDDHPADTSSTDDLSAVETAVRALDRAIARAIEVTLSLANARDRATEASQLKSRFLANVSHELRTPLTAILGYTELLEEDAVGQARDDLGRVSSAARQLLLLVDDVLDLARIESGKMVLDLRPFDLAALVEEVRQLAVPLAARRGNALEVDIAEDVGVVVLDRARVRQILLNLVGNAAKFTDHGRIRIVAERSRDRVHLSVVDTGCGIAPDRLPSLFQPFVQLSVAPGREGTGLGLAISAQFAALMGGAIAVDSTVGAGSRFTVRLPLDATLLDTPLSTTSTSARPAPAT